MQAQQTPDTVSNAVARQIILHGPQSALDMTQQIYANTFSPVSNPTQNYNQIKYVGLLKGFVLEVVATIMNTSGATISLTDFGLWNLLAPVNGVQFLDLNAYQRIQAGGWYLGLLQEVRRRRPYSATAQFNTANGNSVSQMPNVPPALWPVFQAPATIAAGQSAQVRAQFEIPIAFSDDDLRGAMWVNSTQATVQFSIQANPQPVSAAGADSTFAVYSGGTGTITSMTHNIYQRYLDQLPRYQSGRFAGSAILPNTDIGLMYKINNTNFTGLTAGQDFPIAYPNIQTFQSTTMIYNNNGAAANGRNVGTDINYLALRAANTINIFQYDPLYSAAQTREMLGRDLPPGMYYTSHRRRPLNTSQFGNLNYFINPITATANAYVNIGWESFVPQSLVPNMASLPMS